MKINHTVEREDGSYTFQGNLEPNQVKYLLEVGINYTLAQGALPFMHADDRPIASIVPPNTEFPQ